MEVKKLVPELRFKGFDEEWSKKKIGNVLQIGSGKDYKHLNDGNIPVFGTGGLMAYVNKPLYTGETVFIGRKGSIDKPFYYEGDFWTVDTLFYTFNFNLTIPKFIYAIFQKINWYQHNEASGVPSLSKKTIESIPVNIPSLPEQQKIASFLSAVDEKIQQLTRKKELLEQYKKGVMQQLFSGKLRFKDGTSTELSAGNGKDYPEWEVKKLGEIAYIKKGKQLNKENLTETGKYLCINGGISPSGFTDDYNTLENTITISEGGNSCGFINFFKSKFWSGGHNYSIELINEIETDNDFLFQLLKQNQTEIMSLRVGSGLPNIQKKDLNVFSFLFPNSIQEQQKIANFLSGIDDKIESTTQQINQTQTFKKGLLQKMFV